MIIDTPLKFTNTVAKLITDLTYSHHHIHTKGESELIFVILESDIDFHVAQ